MREKQSFSGDPKLYGGGFSFLGSEEGVALITTLLLLALMTLSGFALLYFATRDIQVSGNDRVSRTLMPRMEAVNFYVVQDLMDRDLDDMLRGSSSRPGWLYEETEAAPMVRKNFAAELKAGKAFNALVDKDLLLFMGNWPDSGTGVFSLTDVEAFPFIGNGRGRALAVDMGPSGVGSQDIGGAVLHEYIVFSEYTDEAGNVRFLETGMLRKH